MERRLSVISLLNEVAQELDLLEDFELSFEALNVDDPPEESGVKGLK